MLYSRDIEKIPISQFAYEYELDYLFNVNIIIGLKALPLYLAVM